MQTTRNAAPNEQNQQSARTAQARICGSTSAAIGPSDTAYGESSHADRKLLDVQQCSQQHEYCDFTS
jgi:hypothetical protein